MRDNVARAPTALNVLPAAELMRKVVWPFCIAGCMAAYDQEQSFRDLASAAKIGEHIFGTSWKAVEVMETCWIMRRSPRTDQSGTG
jgi:C6 transcription factor Pro1